MELDAISLKAPEINTGEPARSLKELPGLRGFSETNIRLMRIFYEEWKILDENSSVVTDELQLPNNKTNTNSSVTIDNLSILQNTANEIQLLIRPKLKNFPIEELKKLL